MTWKRFEDIEAWQMVRVQQLKIHDLIVNSNIHKNFALKDQMYRSCGSVMDNIAEGFERDSKGEFKTFLAYAKGSCGELRSQLYRCLDLQLISEPAFLELKQQSEFISGKIYKIMQYLNSSEHRGPRFK